MAIRNNGNANSTLGRLRNRIRSTLFAGEEASTDDADADVTEESAAATPTAPGNLFHCASCGTVYIDSEKRVCSGCDEGVEEVRSTLESTVAR
ncbi:hypothetical protein [Haloterrigena alkaliphila]|uniref:Small CPxCG-related zinc finger protein n=1 Tax=Haloterrigena alkaliphila TaxID=2816475 RepID=A0A8A2VD52_9EURY|nr:hypothetical protein [Haloterrigena alkaliphila]QSW99146.1 hypothetical protein J0X25_17475 [Haloterrigena alkaliphila]